MNTFTTAFVHNDRILFEFINQRLHCRILNRYFIPITHLGSMATMMVFVIGALFRVQMAGILLATNLLISQLIIHSLKRIVNRSRPYATLECNLVCRPPECIYSFPSGHSGASLSAALVLATFFPDLSVLFFALAFSVSFSRVYLGFHFVSDVIAGLLIAYLTFSALNYFIL